MDAGQLQSIASAPRLRLVSALEALGEASARELGAHLGRSPQSLYFHLQKLVDGGLVEEAGERAVGHRAERVYRLVAKRLRVAGDPSSAPYREALVAMCGSITRAAERDYTRALEHGDTRLRGRGQNVALHHDHVHLTAEHRARVVRMLEELTRYVLDHNEPERGELFSYTAILAPVRRSS